MVNWTDVICNIVWGGVALGFMYYVYKMVNGPND